MTTSKSLRVAIIGAGRMGRFYAEKVAQLNAKGVMKLCAVVDSSELRASELAKISGVDSFGDFRCALRNVDAAIVATPSATHCEIALAAMRAGVDVLVEKPIATTLADAQKMVAEANSLGRVLYVGHQEWWNPALQTALPRIGKPCLIRAQRLGYCKERGLDDSVVIDLMIHDIHIVQSLLGERPVRIDAVGIRVFSDTIDEAHAKIEYPRGRTVLLSASRASPIARRHSSFHSLDSTINVDFLEQRAVIESSDSGLPAEILELPPNLTSDDNLVRQLHRFMDSIQCRTSDGTTNALQALQTALHVSDVIEATTTLEQSLNPSSN